MNYTNLVLLPIFASAIGIATPAAAQESAHGTGAYVVGRIGAQIDSDLKFKGKDLAAPSVMVADVDNRKGQAFEAGVGYALGDFRLEGTVGYTAASVSKRLDVKSFTTTGRTKALAIGVSGYYDVNTGTALRPFVGAGLDLVRVTERFTRVRLSDKVTNKVNDRDWGFRWHLDAGVGYAVGEGATIELAGRYAQTTDLAFAGKQPLANTGSATYTYRPKMTATSLTVGLRQRF